MNLATFIGVSISEFWEITPYELNIIANSYAKKEKQKFEEKITLEYLNAMWTIQWLGKKSQQPKSLDKIIKDLYKTEKKEMTEDEILEQVKTLNRLFGGKEILDKNGNIV